MPRNRLIAALGVVGTLAALGAAYSVAQLRAPSFHGTYLPESTPSEFTLQAADRGAVSLSGYRGRAVLLFFGYTSCPDVCPLTMARLREVMERLGERRRDVQVILVTVDPEVDTPHRLREYVQNFDLGFVGLGGDRARLTEVATSFGIYAGEVAAAGTGDRGPGTLESGEARSGHAGHGAEPEEAGGAAPNGSAASADAARSGARIIPHTSHILGLDRDGALRVLWAPDVPAEQIAADVRGLLRL